MSFDDLRRRLTPMDAFFLYAERPEQPMHVGATCIFDGKISHKNFMRHLEGRLHLIPRYQQRVMPAPFNLGHPTWESDPDFDLNNHIFRVSLKGTCDEEELRTLSGKIFTGLLDRNKPLWEIYVVEGLSQNRTALVFKVHHCMVDGVAGIGLALVAFDMTPESVKVKKQPHNAPPIPEPGARLYDALWDNAIDGIEHWTRFQRSLVNFGKGFDSSDVARAVKKFVSTMTGFLLPYAKTPFNGPLSPDRHVAWLDLSFADVRAVRVAAGGTVNDVILAALGCAVKKFMTDRGEEKKIPRSLRVLVPVNVRQEHERGALGNHISFMPVEVPLQYDDPIEILQAVHINTHELKDSKVPESVGLMFEALQGMPAPLQALALNSAANPVIQELLSYFTAMPPANMICTNVPGPNIPLYVLGKRLTAMYPKVPVVMEMGINLALTSYDQRLFLCFCADGRSGKSVEHFQRCYAESFAALREAADVKTANYVRITRGNRPEENPAPQHAHVHSAPEQHVAAHKAAEQKGLEPKAAQAVAKKKAAPKKVAAAKGVAKKVPAKKAVARKPAAAKAKAALGVPALESPAPKVVRVAKPAKAAKTVKVSEPAKASEPAVPAHVEAPVKASTNGHAETNGAGPTKGTPRIHLTSRTK